jgi:uncharacterized protein (DUF433 family)
VDPDLVVGEVEHGGERHDFGVFELPERRFDVGLGSVGGNDVGDGPVVVRLVNRIRFPKYSSSRRPRAWVSTCQVRCRVAAQQSAELPEDLTIVYEIMTGQLALAYHAQEFIERVDFAPSRERWAQRVHPAGRESPVVIDPGFSFGAPSIRGIKTNAIAELVEAGEPPEAVADDFSLQLAEVKAAVSYEWQRAA